MSTKKKKTKKEKNLHEMVSINIYGLVTSFTGPSRNLQRFDCKLLRIGVAPDMLRRSILDSTARGDEKRPYTNMREPSRAAHFGPKYRSMTPPMTIPIPCVH